MADYAEEAAEVTADDLAKAHEVIRNLRAALAAEGKGNAPSLGPCRAPLDHRRAASQGLARLPPRDVLPPLRPTQHSHLVGGPRERGRVVRGDRRVQHPLCLLLHRTPGRCVAQAAVLRAEGGVVTADQLDAVDALLASERASAEGDTDG